MTFCDSFRVQGERTRTRGCFRGVSPERLGPVEVGMRRRPMRLQRSGEFSGAQADCRLDPQSRDFRSAGIDRPWGCSGSALGLYPATYDRWILLLTTM